MTSPAAPRDIGPVQYLSPSVLFVSPFNVRYGFPVELTDEDVAEVRAHGIRTPLTTRPSKKKPGHYEVVCGARRLAAAQAAGLERVPCSINATMTDEEALIESHNENDKRKDPDAIQTALIYKKMLAQTNERGERIFPTSAALAARLHKAEPTIADYMTILTLAPETQKLVSSRTIGFKAAVRLAYGFKERPEDQAKLAGLVQGLPIEEQIRIVDAVRSEPSLLNLSSHEFRTYIEGILSEFTPEERRLLAVLYKKCGLDSSGIKWSKMTRKQYELEVVSKQRFLEGRRGGALLDPHVARNSRKLERVEVKLADLPPAKQLDELDAQLAQLLEEMYDITLTVVIQNRTISVPLAMLRLQESHYEMLKALLASHILTETDATST